MQVRIEDLIFILFLISGAYLSYYTRKLTVGAALIGLLSGLIIYCGTGYGGISLLAVFFLTGTISTAWGNKIKRILKKTGDSEQRGISQVLANSGMATLLSLIAIIYPAYREVLLLMAAGSLSSATADTLSSELGMMYGKRFYNCITLKKESPGLDGVISIEGTLIGAGGALLITIVYGLFSEFKLNIISITFAGIAGNFSDSIFGAVLERKNLLTNDWVNFLSTLFAAIVTIWLSNSLF